MPAIREDVSGIAIFNSATMGDALPADIDLRASGDGRDSQRLRDRWGLATEPRSLGAGRDRTMGLQPVGQRRAPPVRERKRAGVRLSSWLRRIAMASLRDGCGPRGIIVKVGELLPDKDPGHWSVEGGSGHVRRLINR